MLQFDELQVSSLRGRARRDRSAIDALLAETAELRSAPLAVQETGRATWGHYYACPDHGVRLVHELARPDSYECPVDGKRWTGEPYEGAWWRLANGKNADGARDLAYLWLLTGEASYRELALRILTAYAERYPSYEVHGNIPHNGPGRANCQTLCEGMFIRSLAQAWDLLRGTVDHETAAAVERDLFAEAGDFLAAHLTPQRHNHEVLVAGALGMVGILLGREDLVAAARDAEYGLAWQLGRAVLSDGFWFEGSAHYHAFALEAFFVYETFAKGTPHTLWTTDGYRRMLRFGRSILRGDGAPPLLNDGGSEGGPGVYPELFEYAYAQDGSDEWAETLRFLYARTARGGTATFLHGADSIPPGSEFAPADYRDRTPGGSGLTVLRGDGSEYLLFRHGPFGGEHDHYDRLGLCYHYRGERVIPDLSTISYGSPMHYRYYKNSAAHSVVVLDGCNHPPADCALRSDEDRSDGILVSAEVSWTGPYRDFGSHYRTEWMDGPYRNARFVRTILKAADYFIDLVEVSAPAARTIDLNALIAAAPGVPSDAVPEPDAFAAFASSSPYGAPYAYLSDARALPERPVSPLRFLGPSFDLQVALLDEGAQTILARGPDNPPQGQVSYLVRRVRGASARFVAVYRARPASAKGAFRAAIEDARPDRVTVSVVVDGTELRHELPLYCEKFID